MRRIVLSLVLVLSSMTWAVNGNMGNGDGSAATPYLIEDLVDFDTFADPNSAATYWVSGVHTKLMTDIDLSGRTYTTAVIAPDIDIKDFDFQGTVFSGIFDGNRFAITNMTIFTADANDFYLGLFGMIEDQSAVVKNLGIENLTITSGLSSDNIGGLCGRINSGTIHSCYATGRVQGDDYLGGLCGYNHSGTIIECFANITISSGVSSWLIGGLCGYNSYGTISDCYATGTVTGGYDSWAIGGLCGYNLYGTINTCYANTAVTGGKDSHEIGGLCGLNMYSTAIIKNSYATGNITCGNNSRYLGGLCGYLYAGNISDCYATGTVSSGSSSNYIAGFCGYQSSPGSFIENCFWDIDTSGLTVGYYQSSYPGTIINVIGKKTHELITKITFTNVGWDFSDDDDPPVWMMLREGEDTPRLAWQEIYAGDIAGLYGVDMVDFAYLAGYWGQDSCTGTSRCGRADIDISGDVGIGDLAAVAEDWMK